MGKPVEYKELHHMALPIKHNKTKHNKAMCIFYEIYCIVHDTANKPQQNKTQQSNVHMVWDILYSTWHRQ